MALTAQDIANLELLGAGVSGSCGDRTWTRNAHGPFHRARVTPANPQTFPQQFYRSRFRDLSRRWGINLTALQRSGWDAYATRRRQYSRGPRIKLSGFNEYIRHNFPRRRNGIALVDDAPDLATGLEVTKMSVTMTAPSPNLMIDFNTSDPWRFWPSTYIIVNATDLRPSSINSYKPPYRSRGRRLSTIIPPFAIPISTPSVRGQRVFYFIQVVTGDGRISGRDRDRVIVA